jgi:hypothetical protein
VVGGPGLPELLYLEPENVFRPIGLCTTTGGVLGFPGSFGIMIVKPKLEGHCTYPGKQLRKRNAVTYRYLGTHQKKVPGGTFIAQTAPNWAPYPQLYNI